MTESTSGTAGGAAGGAVRQKRSWKRRLRWAGVVVVVVAVLLVVGLWQGVPAVAKHVVMPRLSERLAGEATLDEATFNPFTLRLEMRGIEVVDEAGAEVLAVAGVVADVRWATVWRLVPTLSEVTMTEPRLSVEVLPTGEVNWVRLLRPMRGGGGEAAGGAGSGESSGAEAEDDAGLVLPGVVVERLVVTGGQVRSRVVLPAPRPAFEQTIGPIELDLADVTTAPGERNGYVVETTLPDGARATLTGEVVLHDLLARGELVVTELGVPLYNGLLDGQLGFVVDSGRVSVEVGYELGLLPPEPRVGLELRGVELSDLAFRAFDAEEPFYRLNRFALGAVDAAVTARGPKLTVGRIEIGEGVFEIDRMPGKPPPLQDLLKMWLHTGFAELAERVRADMVRYEREVAPAAVAGLAAGESSVGDALLSVEGIAKELAARAAARGAVPLSTGQLTVRELVAAALGSWELEIVAVAVGAQSSALHGEPFVGFASARIDGVTSQTQPLGFRVERASAVEPWAEFVLTDAGELLVVREGGARIEAAAAATPEVELVLTAEPGEAAGHVSVFVGEATATDGRVTLIDQGAYPPLRNSVERLDGRVTGLSTSAGAEAAGLTFSAWVNGSGVVEGAGTFNLFSEPVAIDFETTSEGVPMIPLSRYGGVYLGYAIKSGAATTATTLDLDGSQIRIDNRVVLDAFYLGESVESDRALSVPVKLGLSLLRDRDGVIDIELPVSGDLSDPEIDTGKLIEKAILNLITRVVAAPFDFIAGVFGGEGAEAMDLSGVAFEPGLSTVGVRGERKASILHRALSERPGLTLAVVGGYDAAADGAALRADELDRRVAAWLAERAAEQDVEGGEPATREAAIAAMYAELAGGDAGGDEDGVEVAAESQAVEAAEAGTHRPVARGARGRSASAVTRAVSEPAGAGGTGTGTGAEAAGSSTETEAGELAVSLDEMREAVLDSIELAEGALEALGRRRAEAVVAAVVVEGEAELAAERVVVRGVEAGEAGVMFELE
ncbi:MAG: DUF748 domain-containing protein [Planctomycetota bacterium]